ncbi:MAG TPA: galactose-1-phosphate uridylyltransferase, partial [Clostridia bacterium]|nr:galactose-1-phosphate uridylyltransferase [Clostridia bacterium]
DLIFRNNRTSSEHPLGIFHPHSHLHHIKKENIGLIEMMGLFILPGRLDNELKECARVLTGELTLVSVPDTIAKHVEWLQKILAKYGYVDSINKAESILKEEIGLICSEILENAGVFKIDAKGFEAYNRFLYGAGFEPIVKA